MVMGAVPGAMVPGVLVPGAIVPGAAQTTAAAGNAVQAADDLRAKFSARLAAIAGQVDAVVGYEIVDLTSNDRFQHLEAAVFPTASTIKLAIVYELFKRSEEGRVKLDQSIVLDRAKAVGGTGVLSLLGTPTLSIRDYATLMVTLSDNTATNVLIDALGMSAITQRMASLGLANTKLRRHMMDTAAARRGDENISTPAEVVRLLEALKTMPQAIELLKLPKDNRLRRGLPAGVESADKSGELDGVRVDAGLVFVPGRPYAFSVMMSFLKNDEAGEAAIVEMSRTAYDYFVRAGARFGRRQ
jgi:beta-lactamase class A